MMIRFADLAESLFADTPKRRSASQRLSRWIRADPELRERLHRAGFRKGDRLLTPRQADIIRELIG